MAEGRRFFVVLGSLAAVVLAVVSTPAGAKGGNKPAPSPPPSATPALSSVSVSPSDVVGGDPVTGRLTLTAPAAAGGFAAALSSDDPSAATVPASVVVPAGATSTTFPVTTNVVPNPRSSVIVATAGSDTVHTIVTAWTPSTFSNGVLGIVPGGAGNGTITSQPAGITCTITGGNGSGTCSATFPVGTVVRLTARPAADSSFLGWRPTPGCGDASKVTIARGAFISCQPGFVVK